MIKVNLVGAGRKKKKAKVGLRISLPASFTPVLLLLVILGSGAGGYWWYAKTANTLADLDKKKAEAEMKKAELDAIIKADQIFEARKKTLENRVKIIEGLQKNQVSPVVVLDQLADAVERTRWVWLSNLDQRDAVLNMSGTATSLNAIADFSSNLNSTGYFKSIDPGSTQMDVGSGNWTFTIHCEFSPPRPPAPPAAGTPPKTAGGN
jgi:Tfp pilus assembly protein PilN